MSSITKKKVNFKNYFGVSSLNIFVSTTGILLNSWLMYYYTTYCNLSIISVGALFSLVKFASAIFCLFFGDFSDRFGSTKLGKKFGRRRFFLLIVIPLHTIIFPLVWLRGMSTSYYYIIYLLYNFIIQIPQVIVPTLTTEMTESSEDRAKIEGVKQAAGTIANTLFSALPGFIILIFGENADSYFKMVLLCDALALVFLVLQYLWTYERPAEDIVLPEKTSVINTIVNMIKDLFATIKIKAFRQQIAIFTAQQAERSISGYVNTYFIVFALGLATTTVSGVNSIAYIFGLIFLSFFMWYTMKTDGPTSFRLGAISTILVFLSFALIAIFKPPYLSIWLIALTILLNFGKTGICNATLYLQAFIPDIDEIVTTRRREGIFSGIFNFIDTIIQSLISLAMGIILSFTGFQEGATVQSELTVNCIIALYAIVPIVFGIWGIIVSYKFKISKKNHVILLNEIERLKSGESMDDVKPEVKDVIENLTGMPYKECWGNNNIASGDSEPTKVLNS